MFTSKELSLIHLSYFIRHKITDDFIELESISTNHLWIIKKLHQPSKYPIQIFHKHNQHISYYHKHSGAYSVQQALQQIKSHDNYVLLEYSSI
jgi:hypothetical protein